MISAISVRSYLFTSTPGSELANQQAKCANESFPILPCYFEYLKFIEKNKKFSYAKQSNE